MYTYIGIHLWSSYVTLRVPSSLDGTCTRDPNMNLIIQYGLLGLVLGLGLGLGFILYCTILRPLALPYMCPQPHPSIGYIAIPEEIAVFRTIHGLLPLPRVEHCQRVLKSMSRTNCTRQIIHTFQSRRWTLNAVASSTLQWVSLCKNILSKINPW